MDTKSLRSRRGTRVGFIGRGLRQALAVVATSALMLTQVAWADGRTTLKPGWNMFSPQQDVEVGQQVSRDAERQIRMLNDSRVDNYINNLGRRLAAHAPGYQFPYTYRVVNDRSTNAFALPGGAVYINRGVIEAADNEAQLASVMAHETAHVALRHGTNQASKASAAQIPLAVLGGLMGRNSTGAMLAQLGAGFAMNSILLKYSRSAESQADVMGTQILYDSGYDARAMAQFFEKIQAQDKGGRSVEFFSNHPNPDNRVHRVDQEIDKLGGSQRGYNTDSREFDEIQRYVRSLPAPPARGQQQWQSSGDRQQREMGAGSGTAPEWPSERSRSFQNSILRMDYPDNWQAHGQGDAAAISPPGGLRDDGNGNQALTYGVLVNNYEPRWGGYNQQQQTALQQATDQLIEELRASNRNLRVIRYYEDIRVDGESALSTYLSNNSANGSGGGETNWLVTVQRPEGLLFIVFVAPDRDFQGYESTFQQMLRSIRISR